MEKGASKITLLVFGTLVGVLLYCGYRILPFYYCYFELENQFSSVIKVASTHTDQELRQKLMYHIKKLEVPVDPDQLIIEREDGVMKIGLQYQEVFYITFKDKDYDIHTFDFHAYSEGRY